MHPKRLKLMLSYFTFSLFPIASCTQKTVEFSIVHTDALAGAVLASAPKEGPSQGVMTGGAALTASLVEDLRKKSKGNLLLLNSGSSFFGSNEAFFTEGRITVEVMNRMKFDAMTLGNREFDFGVDVLTRRAQQAEFPLLGANIKQDNENNILPTKPYRIFTLGGVKIGVVGIVGEHFPQVIFQGNMKGITILPALSTAQKTIESLKASKVDLIVAMTHFDTLQESRDFAAKIGGSVDLVIARNWKDEDLLEPERIDGVPIVFTARRWTDIGEAKIQFDLKKRAITSFLWQKHKVNEQTSKPDPQIAEVVRSYQQEVEKTLSRKLGFAETPFGHNFQGESGFGNFVTDTLKKAFQADFAFYNSGGMRALEEGDVTLGSLAAALPFDNSVVVMKLSGKQIKDLMSHSTQTLEKTGLLQMSGLKLSRGGVDPLFPFSLTVMATGEEIEAEKLYTIATSSFLSQGGDGYTAFKSGQDVEFHTTTVRKLLEEEIKRQGRIKETLESRVPTF